MGIFGTRKAAYAATALAVGVALMGAPPATAAPKVTSAPAVQTPSVGPTAVIDGVPYVGAELRSNTTTTMRAARTRTAPPPTGTGRSGSRTGYPYRPNVRAKSFSSPLRTSVTGFHSGSTLQRPKSPIVLMPRG